MAIATGVNKILAAKKETTWGVAAGTGSGQILGRITSDLSLKKEKYASQEIVSHYQLADSRHGVRSIRGNLKGELAPGAQQMFLAAALRQTFAAIAALTGLSITVAGSGPAYTLTRSAGDYLAAGLKLGAVVRLTAGSFNAANLNKNLLIVAITATVLTVIPLNGVALFAEGPIASATVTVPGKTAYAAPSSQTDDSFSIEHWHSDIAQSELYLGCKVQSLAIDLPPSGLAGVDIALFGKDWQTATAQYFVSPSAASSAGKLASVNGAVILNGTPVALLTGLRFTINGNMSSEAVVGSNNYPDIFEGRMLVDGSMTVMFQDAVARGYFDAETEITIIGAFTTGSAAAADYMSFVLPRVKVSSADKDDGEKAIKQTMNFDGLYYGSGGAALASNTTTLQVFDSLAA